MCENEPIQFITNRGQNFKKKLTALQHSFYEPRLSNNEEELRKKFCSGFDNDSDNEDDDFNFHQPCSKTKKDIENQVLNDFILKDLTMTFCLQLKFEGKIFKAQIYYDKPFLDQLKVIAESLNVKDEKSLIFMYKENMISFEESPKSLHLSESDFLDCFLIVIEEKNKNESKRKKRKVKGGKKGNKKLRNTITLYDSCEESMNIDYIDLELNEKVSSFFQQCQALANHADLNKKINCKLKKKKNFTPIEKEDNISLNSNETESDSNMVTIKFKYEGTIIRLQFDHEDCFWLHLREIYDKFKIEPKYDLVIMHNDKVISNDETPKSLNLTVVDILDCFIKSKSKKDNKNANDEEKKGEKKKSEEDSKDLDYIQIKIRNNLNLKRNKIEKMKIKKNEQLFNIMKNYSQIIKHSLDEMIFEFDGEKLSGKETSIDLEMEDDSLIDVYIKK